MKMNIKNFYWCRWWWWWWCLCFKCPTQLSHENTHRNQSNNVISSSSTGERATNVWYNTAGRNSTKRMPISFGTLPLNLSKYANLPMLLKFPLDFFRSPQNCVCETYVNMYLASASIANIRGQHGQLQRTWTSGTQQSLSNSESSWQGIML